MSIKIKYMNLLKLASWFTKYRRLKKKYKARLEDIARLKKDKGRIILRWDIDNEERKLLMDCIKEYRKSGDKQRR